MKLRDMVEPVASDFSKLCEGISQGAKMFSDQVILSSELIFLRELRLNMQTKSVFVR